MLAETDAVERERKRIEAEYRRRETEVSGDLYAPWAAAENFIVAERKTAAARLLHEAGKFPQAGDACLEIGYGKLGWLADLISWGLREPDLHGIELNEKRAALAQAALPQADLRTGDATLLPWADNSFKLVVVSTVFSSILEANVRKLIAGEISRVLTPGGTLLWYDLAVNNPRNPNVSGIGKQELKNLFSGLDGKIQSVTLAPPLARALAGRSLTLATFLSAFPFLRTHLLAALAKRT